MEVDDETEPSTLVRKSTRIRKTVIPPEYLLEEKTPKKKPKTYSLEDIYLQKDFKLAAFKGSPLETIYEAPTKRGNSSSLMSGVKLKRQCKFTPHFDPSSVKKKQRKNKATKLKRLGIKVPSGKTITIEQVREALKDIIESNDDEHVHNVGISQKENLSTSPPNAIKELSADMSSLNVGSCDEMSSESNVKFLTPSELQRIEEFAPITFSNKSSKSSRRRSSNNFRFLNLNGPVMQEAAPLPESNNNFETLSTFNDEIKSDHSLPLVCDANNESSPISVKRKPKSSRGKVPRKKRRGQRRDSGILPPIFSPLSHEPDSDSPEPLEFDSSKNLVPKIINIKNSYSDSKGHRRSARLSICRGESNFGSLWN